MYLSAYGDGQGQWNDIPCSDPKRFTCKISYSKSRDVIEFERQIIVYIIFIGRLGELGLLHISETCPQNWEFWNGKCYHISDDLQTWNISLDKCKENDGATLLSWHSQDEIDHVMSNLLSYLILASEQN